MSDAERLLESAAADRIIRRALDLDAQRGDKLTEAQLRDVAAQLSISDAAVDQALAEHRATSVNEVGTASPPRSRWRSLGVTIPLVVISTLILLMIVAMGVRTSVR